jgi:Prenyltransferase and squalene oxidase repeat
MMRWPRAILRSIDHGRISFRNWSALPRFAPLFLAVSLAASVTTLSGTASTAQVATPGALSESTAMSPVEAASTWLREQQDTSGGFSGLSGEPDSGTTADTLLALYAAQQSDPAATASLDAALAYLEQEENGAVYAETGPGQAAKLALAAVTGGRDPRHFAGLDLVAAMTAPLATPVPDGIGGIYGDDLYDHALVLIALSAAGEAIPKAALEPLRTAQGEDGGWAFDGSTAPGAADSNTTALVIQALVAAGYGDDPMVDRGLAFLSTLLAPEGGFAYGPADPLIADANSTALALQALIAAGEDPTTPEWGNAPLALARFQTPSGGLRFMAADEEPNLLATIQAIPAMEGLSLPVARACAEGDDGEDCIPLEPAA